MESKYVPPNETVGDFPINHFFEDQPTRDAEPATLERLVKLANDAKALEAEINDDTVALEEKNGRLDKILKGQIPSIFETLGIEEYKLVDGSKITVKGDIKCGITEERKPAAFAWLRETSNDGIIKTAVSLSFGKGESLAAEKAVTVLQEAGFDATTNDTVHPSTLKSFVKECLEKGVSIPMDTFGVYDFKIAQIALPKTRKTRR